MQVHLLLEPRDLARNLGGTHVLGMTVRCRGLRRLLVPGPAARTRGISSLEDIGHILDHSDRHDAMRGIVLHLLVAAAFGLADGTLHRARLAIGIEYCRTVQVARRASDGLYQRALRTQEALLVGIENRDQRNFRHIEAFAQQVDSDQHIELARRKSRMISTRSTVSISECR